MKEFKIRIKGVSEPVSVSQQEYEFVMAMIKHRRCNHWFNIAGYTVMIGDEVTLIKPDDVEDNKLT